MEAWILNLLGGPIISIVVTFLKKIPFVANYPKVAAAIVAILVEAANVGLLGGSTTVLAIVSALAATFGGAVATHEVVLKPAIAAAAIVTPATGDTSGSGA